MSDAKTLEHWLEESLQTAVKYREERDKLQVELDALKARIKKGIRVWAFDYCGVEAVQDFRPRCNATLLIDEGVDI